MKDQLYSHDTTVKAGKSMTKQSGAQTPADVFRKFKETGELPIADPPLFGDISEFSYAAQRDNVAAFNSAFAELPARVRDSFDNDPAKYAGFLAENEEKIAADGLSEALKASQQSEKSDEIAQKEVPKDESGTE